MEGYTPRELAERLGERGIFTWDGNYYAINLAERLGVQQSGGMLRIGLAHYNTAEEVDRLLAELSDAGRKDEDNLAADLHGLPRILRGLVMLFRIREGPCKSCGSLFVNSLRSASLCAPW